MTRRRTLKLILGVIGVAIVAVIMATSYVFYSLSLALADPPPNHYSVYFEGPGETIFFRARSWGVTGDHQEIVIANSPIESYEPDENRQLIYRGQSSIYYRKTGNTLEIHAGRLTKLPPNFSSLVDVKQVELDSVNPEEVEAYASRLGLSKVTVYLED